MRRNNVLRVAALAGMVASPAQVLAVVGRYLPDLPVDFGTSKITAYGTVHQFDRDVLDAVKNIDVGEIRFDYAKAFEEFNAPSTTKAASAALKGGLFLNPGVTKKPGFELGWVQMVTATDNGANSWGLPATGSTTPFPDAGPAHPGYPNSALAGATIAFEDFPNRGFDKVHNWEAELALVCIANNADGSGFREVRVVSSFFWGFSANPNAPFTIDDVGETPPTLYGIPTNNFVNTMNSYYDGQGPPPGNTASSKFLFSSNSNCFIPEPGTVWLLVIASGLSMRRRRLS